MRKMLLITCNLALLISMISCSTLPGNHFGEFNNEASPDRMLLVLSAPSIYEPYYEDVFDAIVDFQVKYAQRILGNDNVVVIVDADTRPYYEGRLPEDVLITADVYDIWMRDFTTVNPVNPVQFNYTWASMTYKESIEVQNSFNSFANLTGLQRTHTDLLLDGGNIVDNYAGGIITTTRFLEDNGLSASEGKQQLRSLLGADAVAIIEPDEEVLAHSDGMACWIDNDVLLVNDYSEDPEFRQTVLDELSNSFPAATIIEVPFSVPGNSGGQFDDFESACGINLNATVTYKNIYVPLYGMDHEADVMDIIRSNSSKNVIEVPAGGVCEMGGSVRCLTWQLAGEHAERFILSARER